MSFFGKVFLLTALAGYSYLLLQEPSLGKQFDQKYQQFTSNALVKQYVPPTVFSQVPPLLARQVVAGLLGSSVLLFICGGFVLFPILGLLLQIAVVSNPFFYNDQHTQIDFLKNVALIGGLLLWASSNCCSKRNTKVKQE